MIQEGLAEDEQSSSLMKIKYEKMLEELENDSLTNI